MKEYSNSDLIHAVDEWVHSARDRQILKRRLVDGLTYDELSSEFNLSVRRIKDIVYKAQNDIYKHL